MHPCACLDLGQMSCILAEEKEIEILLEIVSVEEAKTKACEDQKDLEQIMMEVNTCIDLVKQADHLKIVSFSVYN